MAKKKKKKLTSKIKSGTGKALKPLANPYVDFAITLLESIPAFSHGGSVKKKKYAHGGGVRKTKMMDY